jgi:uncharacterized protein (DUF58 family)
MADSLAQGDNPSSVPGRGVEVSGIREYQPGDEARGIDWRVTARRGRLFVKEFSQERELPVLVILSQTPSLWAGRGGVKAIRAMEASALLTAMGLRAGDRVGLLISGGLSDRIVPPGNGRTQLPRILAELMAQPSTEHRVPLGETLSKARFLLHQRARVFLIGDFQIPLSELSDLGRGLETLRDRHVLIPVRVRDSHEGSLPATGSFVLRDPDSGELWKYRGVRSARKLRTLLEKRERETSALFRGIGLEEWTLDVDEPLLEGIRRHLFQSRTRVSNRGSGRTLTGEAPRA